MRALTVFSIRTKGKGPKKLNGSEDTFELDPSMKSFQVAAVKLADLLPILANLPDEVTMITTNGTVFVPEGPDDHSIA